MKLFNFKYLFSLIAILGIFLTSCTNTTDPVSDTNTESLKKIEYTPSVEEAQSQAEQILTESFKTILEGNTVSKQNSSLSKSADGTYTFIDGWHTWRGTLSASPFDVPDSYNSEYLAKIQFQNGSQNMQILPTDAQYMLMYLNVHAALGFIGDDPRGDEVWYSFNGAVNPLTGNPSMINSEGTYERRWVGDYSTDGENWQLTEIMYKFAVTISNLKFYYDSNADDFYLSGKVILTSKGIRVVAKFANSRTAKINIYQNGSLVQTTKMELPNFYQVMNIPSLSNWNFGSGFNFPSLLVF